MNRLIDQEIAHITRVMWPSLLGDMGGAILSSEYWRMRLHALLDAPSLTKVQLCALDSLLLRLDHYDQHGPDAYSTPADGASADDRTAHNSEPVALHG
ncbi:hypothetical protein G3N95_08245 [Paraburkholderia sp. Tr-20389]|uniref:hypothetical protein n=1 Tax=Paraburkholderia sp. Tr-20389 TaxID=2703903 RepID=UPI00197CEEF5|nr:hypothetical protein [Paraburkholderia sp. Tr-20389]MBN3752931.1 hypothetical protein [Paraburkholderia sp. Tr-20389]